MLIYEMKDSFKKHYYRFSEEPKFFLLILQASVFMCEDKNQL